MKRPLVPILAACLVISTIGLTDDPAGGTHDLSGPVDLAWEARFDGASSLHDVGRDIGVSPDGSTVFVTGYSQDPSSTDYATVAYDAETGEQVWMTLYDGTGQPDSANAMVVTPDGSTVIVTGSSTASGALGSKSDIATAAYDATTGSELWVRRVSHLNNNVTPDVGNAIAVSPDSLTVFVAGFSAWYYPWYDADYRTLAYDIATGDLLWSALYGTPQAPRDDVATAVAVSPDGATVFVTGRSETSNRDFATVAYDASTGEELWDARTNTGVESAWDITVTPDGTLVVVTGQTGLTYGFEDYLTVAYDPATGEEVWRNLFGSDDFRDDIARSVTASHDGGTVFVTGTSSGFDGPQRATVAYDTETGEELWVAIGENGMAAEASALSPDGETLFLTGSRGPADDSDYATVALNVYTGERIWAAAYDGVSSLRDVGNAIAVRPDGSSIFVTGASFSGPQMTFDLTTVAYFLPTVVEIDIKPGGLPNPVNPYSNGVIPVALLGSEDFDVANVDVTTLAFGAAGAAPRHDLTDEWTYTDHLEDVNLDGFMDLVMHFETQETGILCGDDEATLTGEPLDGRQFIGTDEIVTVGCPPPQFAQPAQQPDAVTTTPAIKSSVFGRDG